MISRIATIAFIPVLAAFIGWSIQPMKTASASDSSANSIAAGSAITPLHDTIDDSSATQKTTARDVVASNR